MKLKTLLVITIFSFFLSSCDKDEDFTQIKGIENLIYLSIKAYRTDNGSDGPFVHQFIMVKEAQIYSYKMANDVEPLGTQGLTDHWIEIHSKIGGTNDQAIVMSTNSGDADVILAEILQVPEADSVLLSDVTQCGVGVEPDSAGLHYITILMMKVD